MLYYIDIAISFSIGMGGNVLDIIYIVSINQPRKEFIFKITS